MLLKMKSLQYFLLNFQKHSSSSPCNQTCGKPIKPSSTISGVKITPLTFLLYLSLHLPDAVAFSLLSTIASVQPTRTLYSYVVRINLSTHSVEQVLFGYEHKKISTVLMHDGPQ